MLAKRGIAVDPTIIYRHIQRYAPEIEQRLLWIRLPPRFVGAERWAKFT